MVTDQISKQLKEVQERLWTERHLLEFLLFKLVTAKLLLAADDRRFMSPALAEVEHVVEKIRLAEMERAMAVGKLAEAWSVPVTALSLRYLAARAEEPYKTIFADHHKGFLEMTQEIEEQAVENRRLASTALTNIQENLDRLVGKPDAGETTYDDRGKRSDGPTQPRRLDAAL